jgi:phosphoglycolate phosphatase-like HAD superfamily hydrolase
MDLHCIRALVFDMGGILYNTPREITLMTRFILEHMPINQSLDFSDEQISNAINLADEFFDSRLVQMNADPHWLPTYEDSVEYDRLLLENLRVEGNLGIMALKAHSKWIHAPPKMKPKFIESCRKVLEVLHSRGYRLGIASNRRNDPTPRLASDGIHLFFEAIEYSCVPGYRKPSPYMLIQVARSIGVNPRRSAYIGDKVEPDMNAARKAGFLPILLVWCAPEEAEKASRDTIVIERFDDLLDLFAGPN